MKSVLSRPKRLFNLILIAVFLSTTWGVARAQSAVIYANPDAPDSVSSDGLCSLREAIISANRDNDSTDDCVSGAGTDTIFLEPSAEYIITKDDNGQENSSSSGDLDITDNLTIIGNGATITAADGYRNRIIHVVSGTAVLENLTISGGGPRRDGGGILNQAILTLDTVTESLGINRELGDGWALAYLLEDIAALNAAEGQEEDAFRLLGAAQSQRERIGAPLPPRELEKLEKHFEQTCTILTQEAQKQALESGRAMSLEQAIESAELSPKS